MKCLTNKPTLRMNTTPKTVDLASEVTPVCSSAGTVTLTDAGSYIFFSEKSAIDLTEQLRASNYEIRSATHHEVHIAC